MSIQRREDFRIEYEAGEGPTLVLEDGIYQVQELSATGVRIRFEAEFDPFVNAKNSFKLLLKFPDKNRDSRIQTFGKYYRHGPGYMVFRFDQQIPSKKLFEEQFRLKKKRVSSV